ncbi:MAG: hypothetical protein ACOCWL_03730 [Thermoguttaceae bacterium]
MRHRHLKTTLATFLCLGTTLLAGANLATADAAPARVLYVAPNGNDAWSGTLPEPRDGDGPFATLQRVREEIRGLKQAGGLPEGGVEVRVREGTYLLDRTLELIAADSGTADAPVTYRAAPGEEVRLSGGRPVGNFTPVTDEAILKRLDEPAREKVVQADPKALGIEDLGEVAASGKRLELFFNDEPMRIARWPNEGFVPVVDVVEETPFNVRGTRGDRSGKIVYEGDRPQRWTEENDLWLHGYWFWDWAEQRMRVQSIDMQKKVIALAPPQHNYGYRKNQWYYAFNALCEIDEPGEWYLDRESGILYFYPPAPVEQGRAVVSVVPTLMSLDDVSHVTVRGFIFEAGRNDGLTIRGGKGVRVMGCTFRNLGEWAVRVSGGTDHGVVGCDVCQTGAGGIALSGGDRATLTPAGHFAVNNHIYEYARWNRVYRPGITLQGVGNRAAHNLIHNAPHMGMGFGGNDHVIELNEIHSVSYESNDAGAIYTGRNWTMRGHVIRHNYLHHISGFRGRGCVGVYLDDMFSSADIIGNVFYRVTRAAMIGGGRDCRVENNIFVDCTPAVHVDARALGWAHGHADGWLQEAKEKGTLSGIAFDKPPYSERYPALAAILENEPKAPVGNVIARNIFHGGRWDGIHAAARPYVELADNLIDEDPRFVDPENGDFRLRDDSPAWALGFERIPVEKIGLYEDEDRASWPVEHTVRPGE